MNSKSFYLAVLVLVDMSGIGRFDSSRITGIRGGQLRRACGLVNKSSGNEAGNIKSYAKLQQIAKGDTLATHKD
jgi:hypothetical protein